MRIGAGRDALDDFGLCEIDDRNLVPAGQRSIGAPAAVGDDMRRMRADAEPGVSAILVGTGLPAGLAEAMDDESFDEALRASHQRGQDALGEAGGSPITGIDGTHFFGPVLSDIPTGADAEALFSSLVTLAGTEAFAQIKRPAGGPPTFSP